MSNYLVTSPSIDSLISHDDLYFEGVKRPLIAYTLRDDMSDLPNSPQHVAILDQYFNDIYHLFLKKLSAFSENESVPDESTAKLQALLQEMIKVKGLIVAATRAGDNTSA